MEASKPRLKLSDVLGAIVSSVASARSVADIEALRIAHRYRQNEFLRGLPVPRLRFSRIAITVPVIITGVGPAEHAEPAAPSTVAQAAAAALRASLAALATDDTGAAESPGEVEQSALEDDESREGREARGLLRKTVPGQGDAFASFEADLTRDLDDELLDRQQQSGGVPLADPVLREVAREVSTKVLRRLLRRALMREQMRAPSPERALDPGAARQTAERALLSAPVKLILQRVCEAAQRAAVVRPAEPADLDVLVDTDAVKSSGGGPGAVTQIHLTLLEEGLEWVQEEQGDGSLLWKLTQE